MHTQLGIPEEYIGSYTYIPLSGAAGLKCWAARRTGIEAYSGKAVYELVDVRDKPVSNILYVIDGGALVPVVAFRAAWLVARAAEYEATE